LSPPLLLLLLRFPPCWHCMQHCRLQAPPTKLCNLLKSASYFPPLPTLTPLPVGSAAAETVFPKCHPVGLQQPESAVEGHFASVHSFDRPKTLKHPLSSAGAVFALSQRSGRSRRPWIQVLVLLLPLAPLVLVLAVEEQSGVQMALGPAGQGRCRQPHP